MKLLITGLGAIAAQYDDIVSVRASDASGSFGILSGHADFLTALDIGVVSWRRHDGSEGHCAVRRGVMTVRDGNDVEVASREAVVDTDLDRLESTVLADFRRRESTEQTARVETARMELRAVRQILRYLRPVHAGYESAPPSGGDDGAGTS